MVKEININTIKEYKENSLKEFVEKIIKEFKIENVKLFTTIDYYKNRYVFNFICETSKNIIDDYKFKLDFEKNYGGHYIEVEEIKKDNRNDESMLNSKTVTMTTNGMIEFKHRLILKESKRDSKKIRESLRIEFVKILKDNNLNFKESA